MRVVLWLTAVLLLAGCTNMRRLEKGKPIRSESASAVVRKHLATLAKPEWSAMKLQVEANLNGERNSFKVNARMRRDSAIWLSITPALGVEVARILLSEDSVYFMSKVPGNRFAYVGGYATFDSLLGTSFTYEMAQHVLCGEGINLLDDESKYISKVDGREHLLINKYKRRVRRLVGVKEKEISPNDSLTVEATMEVQERVMSRSDDADLLVKRYWFDGLGYQLTRTRFDDLYNGRSVEISHGRFEPEAGGWTPHRTGLVISSPEGTQSIEIEIMRARYGKPYPMPFVIPEEVERRNGL
ncbi:MAG: DUF4292 domain-containing protein [Flavobacteriales bacterium]|nr:DUF4292 domain-containing protein [Flavobacteriales bacterium]